MKKLLASYGSILLVAGSLLSACSGGGSALAAESAAAAPDSAAAGSGKKNVQIMRLNMEEPATLDPRFAEDTVSGAIIRQIYDSLTRLDESGNPVNSLASDIQLSRDKLTYTFTLRDALWSNGDPVTAHDFEYTWKCALDPKTGSPATYNYSFLKNGKAFTAGQATAEEVGVKALDDRTLQVTLEHPMPFFLSLVANLPAVNKKVALSNPDWANDPGSMVSNGPFKPVEWRHTYKLVLAKNEAYWDADAVKLDKIEFSMIADVNTALAMFDNGDLDWAGNPLSALPIDAIAPLMQEGKLRTKPKATVYYIRFHTERSPFTNAKVRKAFAYAIHRKEIAAHIGQAGQTPLMGITPMTASLKPDGFFADHQPDEAKKLLQEGMKELGLSKLPPVTYLYNTSERNRAIAEALQATWKNVLGVDVKLLNKETKVFLDDQEQGKFEMTRSGWTADYNDPISFLEKFADKNSTSNLTRWHNPVYAELIQKSYLETDEAKRKQILLAAETLLMEDMPVTGIFSDVNAWVQSDKVKGVRIDPLGKIDLKWAYLE